jgi:hypothetical protein
MSPEEALCLINNHDVREALRKYAPQWSTVAVDASGVIVDVIRHKESPNPQLHRKHMNMYPTTVQFTTWPDRFTDVNELKERVEDCVEVHHKY